MGVEAGVVVLLAAPLSEQSDVGVGCTARVDAHALLVAGSAGRDGGAGGSTSGGRLSRRSESG